MLNEVMQLFEAFNYNEWMKLEEGIEVLLTNTGHLIGSAAVHVRVNEN